MVFSDQELLFLREAAQGCTYFTDMDWEIMRGAVSTQKAVVLGRVAGKLGEKLGVVVPTW